jgi:hypothetical protein
METDAGADVRNVWQLGPAQKWERDPAAPVWWSRDGGSNAMVQLALAPAGASMQVFEGRREPPRGWLGVHGAGGIAAPLVEFRYAAARRGTTASAVLIAPFSGAERPRYTVDASGADRSNIRRLEIGLPGGGADEIAWSAGLELPVDDGRPFTTDGAFVWRRKNAQGAEIKRWLPGGSYLKIAR